MELIDYLTALRRAWRTGVVTLVLCLAVATIALALTPRTYSATAGIFASASPSIPNSAQYVVQRVATYPEVAESTTVLSPVMSELGLQESLADLRAEVAATNPAGTSQVNITVTQRDPRQAAMLADAIANELVVVLPDLEKHAVGDPPIQLTVTDPAIVPTSPVSPVPSLVLGLGLAVGLALGAAAAIVHSRLDTRVHGARDVRRAWSGDGEELTVLSSSRRGRRRSLAGRPAALLGRRLATEAEDHPVRVAALSASTDGEGTARSFVDEVATCLRAWDVSVMVAEAPSGADDGSAVRLSVSSPLPSRSDWHSIVRQHDGVVLVVEPGRVHAADLYETSSILAAAGVRVLAVVLRQRLKARKKQTVPPGSPAEAVRPVQARAATREDAVPASR